MKEQVCNFCEKSFSDTDSYRDHLSSDHEVMRLEEREESNCKICDKSYINLKRHMKSHVEKPNIFCEVCRKSFINQKYLKNHVCNGFNESFYVNDKAIESVANISICKSRNNNSKDLVSHNKRVQNFQNAENESGQTVKPCAEQNLHPESEVAFSNIQENGKINVEEIKCDICDEIFLQKVSLKHHMKIHKTIHVNKQKQIEHFRCEICEKIFNSRYGYKSHLITHSIHEKLRKNNEDESCKTSKNIEISKASYVCSVCDNSFIHKQDLKIHILGAHGQSLRVSCTLCSKTFSEKKNLSKHIANVHELRNMKECNFCGKSFQNISLHRHVREVHEKVRNYKCNSCCKAFPRPEDLSKHMKNFHESSASGNIRKNYFCDICGTSYTEKGSLSLHKKMKHFQNITKQKFTCEICDKHFYGQGYLNSHYKKIHDKGNFQCAICKLTFHNRACLEGHFRYRHKEERFYECVDCDKSFSHARILQKHYLTVHEKSNK